jgi:hypothetical protein
VAAIVLIGLVALGLALLLAVLLPGAGLIGSALVIAAGIAAIGWLLASGGAGKAPSEAVRDTETPQHLGPGGPDDPGQ